MKVRDIILTNSGDTSSFNSLVNSGFILHHFPMIEISHREIRPFSLDKYDFYVFTSKNGELSVEPTPHQGSGVLSSMSKANCLIVLDIDQKSITVDEYVNIQLMEGLV